MMQFALDFASAPARAMPAHRPRARRTDPDTSKQAAERVSNFAAGHYAGIRCALVIGPATIYEIAARTGLDHVAVARRLSEMQRAGIAAPTSETRPGPTGRQCRVWTVA